jgi:hypothetical protein
MYVYFGRSVPTFRMNLLTTSALYLKIESFSEDRSSNFISTDLPNYTASSAIKPVVFKGRCKFYNTLAWVYLGMRRICSGNNVPRQRVIANITNTRKLVVLGFK